MDYLRLEHAEEAGAVKPSARFPGASVTQRDERPHPWIAQPKPAPQQNGKGERHPPAGNAQAHLDRDGDRAAEIPGEQNRAQHGGARDEIDDGAKQFDDADGTALPGGQSAKPCTTCSVCMTFITPLISSMSTGGTLRTMLT
jgi:hypothetical protein